MSDNREGEGGCPVGHPFPPPRSARPRPVGRHVTSKLNCVITWLTDHSEKFHIHFGKPAGQFTDMHVFLAFAKSGIKCLLIKSALGMLQEYIPISYFKMSIYCAVHKYMYMYSVSSQTGLCVYTRNET